MSTSFNFPANPVLNQIVVLPDGNQAQWNGLAWVSVANNVTYPLSIPNGGTGGTNPLTAKRNLGVPIFTVDDAAPAAPVYGDRWMRPGSMTEVVWMPNANNAGVWVNFADVGSVPTPIPINKGGTGATTAAQARTNLGIDYTVAPFLLMDGTVTAPGLAWNSEPGLGLYRPTASVINMAAVGATTYSFDASAAANSFLSLFPRAAGGSAIYLSDGVVSAANRTTFAITTDAGGFKLFESLSGTAVSKPLAMSFPLGGTFSMGVNGQFLFNQTAATNCAVALNAPAGRATDIYGKKNNTNHWLVRLGNGNATDDFSIVRWDDAGTYVDEILAINRTTGNAQFGKIVYVGTGAQQMSIDPITNSTYPRMTFTQSGWRWQLDISVGQLGWFRYDNQVLISFDSVGNASKLSGGTTWISMSDKRAKTNVRDWSTGLDAVLSLRPVIYDRTDTPETDSVGCIADEAEVGFPALIKRGPGSIAGVEYPDVAALNIDPLFWAMVNAFKTLDARLKAGGL